ncbi:MAG: GIY-YIG nuclease family protein [Alcanivorax sp.]|nr:GIY-YIG nuclease family protein [Alcanivorax sp.]
MTAPKSSVLTTLTADLPTEPGIYRFFGHRDELLYIGKSVNIRQRVKSHFSARHSNARSRRMCSQIARIEYQRTAGELGALLLENREIKQHQPIFNRRQRRYRQLHTWVLQQHAEGHLCPQIYRPDQQHPQWHQHCYGLFRSPRQALLSLQKWVREAHLCPRLCGLEAGQGPCFSSQLGYCAGACCGRESVTDHDQRLLCALRDYRIRAWPYAGPLVITEHGNDRQDFHLINQWCHLTTLPRPPSEADLQVDNPASFDLDSYRILMHFLSRDIAHYVMT